MVSKISISVLGAKDEELLKLVTFSGSIAAALNTAAKCIRTERNKPQDPIRNWRYVDIQIEKTVKSKAGK